ncbi:SAM-dependent methyltransferase, partial [Candidatus Uhrbacteria bacterium]|nr:SAM-dependent methyltransferase [Candidatus Uhrbacteria bacterium]
MRARHASSVSEVSAMPRGGPQAGWLDRRMDPHMLEWIDDPAVPIEIRRRTMAGLDRFNRFAGGYWIFAHTALRCLPDVAVDPRILELGA